MEHFFSVLVAVAVFQLNEGLLEMGIEMYVLRTFMLWSMLLHTMRYASTYNDEDGWHKLLWAVFQFVLLLVLEGQARAP